MKPIRISNRFYQCLPGELYKQVETYYLADDKFWDGSSFIGSPRYGKSKIWDFHLDRDYVLIPNLEVSSNKSFEEVTDLRAIEIKNALSQHQKELAVFWSGGIDSTVALAGLVKHLDKEELNSVTVFMNNYSYFENPVFFERIIKKHKLKIKNIGYDFTRADLQQTFKDYIVTDGEPADKLWIVAVVLKYGLINGSDSISKSHLQQKSNIFNFLSQYMSLSQTDQYYNFLIDNISESGAMVETVGDFFWWINFNFHMVGHLVNWYFLFPNKSPETYSMFKQNYYPWYNSEEYQQWSNSDRPKLIPADRVDLYKAPAKQYIYSVLQDDFYLNYKSKLGSFKSMQDPLEDHVILENGQLLDHNDPAILNEFISQYCIVNKNQ
jgi:hypothetical protein